MNLRPLVAPLVIGFVGSTLFASSASAQERQYRKLELIDGRTLRAEVLSTEASGLKMRTPQGVTLVSFELLMDMIPIGLAEYEDQPAERLWLVGATDPGLRAIYDSIPKLEISTPGASKLASSLQSEALEACGADVDCAKKAVAGGDWLWLVFVTETEEGFELRGGPSGAKQFSAITSTRDPYALWKAGNESLELTAPEDVPKSVLAAFPDGLNTKPPATPTTWTAQKVNAASLVPIPGYASLAQGDAGRFGLGLGVGLGATAVVGTVAAVSARDKNGDPNIGAVVGVTVGAYWAISSLVSNALGHATLKADGGGTAVTLVPRADGGSVAVHSTF